MVVDEQGIVTTGAGTGAVTSVDGRLGDVTLSDIYVDQDYEGSSIGRSSGVGPIVVSYSSQYGIKPDGTPYYNADGVTDGDDAILMLRDDGMVVLVKNG